MHAWSDHGPFGGHLFLDFVNTLDDEEKSRSLNAIPDWATILEWGVAATLVSSEEAGCLAGCSSGPAARSEFKRLIEFRETAWLELSRKAANRPASEDNLGKLSKSIRWALAHSVLEPHGSSFRWSPSPDRLGLQLLRARLALSLLELMMDPDIGRLRECGRCTGLFLDQGRGRGRRWCRMTTCGNRAKVERFRSKR